MISREAAGAVLDQMGLRRVDQESWMGFTRAAGRDLNISAHLREVYVQVMVPLNLYTRCDQVPLYEYMLEANSRTALGKFVVGPELPVGGRPIVLVADLPAGPGPTYTTEGTIRLLFQSAVQLLDEHLDRIESRFRQGCGPGSGGGPGSGSRPGQGILDRLRVFRGGHEGQGPQR